MKNRFLVLAAMVLWLPFSSCEKDDNTPDPNKVTDIDGNVYNTVKIGDQTWMKENLKVTRFRNGDLIPSPGSTLVDPAVYVYDNLPANNTVYGKLYNWYAVSDVRGICPAGWHVPTDAEIGTLIDFLGGEDAAGGKLKEAGTTHWDAPNTGATNSSGFTGLPGGLVDDYFGSTPEFVLINKFGVWWSSTSRAAFSAGNLTLDWNTALATVPGADKRKALSVRCIKD
jgi:uncharacterized protein (TIGR02145 family)